jgi:lambda family phage portal protein
MFKEHPGATYRTLSVNLTSSRVPASEVIHIYRQDRPGQNRGISWFANIAMSLQDLADHQDAQLLRQKIAACFAAFRVPAEDEDDNADPSDLSETISPGRIQNLGPGEDIKFAEPPGVQGYDEFKRSVLRDVASGIGITYEALSGDLSNVNFSSARIGRLEMDRAVSSWQWQMLIPQMMDPIARWTMDAFDMVNATQSRRAMSIAWVPPHRMLVDPEGEINMSRNKVRAGFTSRSEVIRGFGEDPDEVLAEIIQDNADADANAMVFDSDARRVSLSGVEQTSGAKPQDQGKTDGQNTGN